MEGNVEFLEVFPPEPTKTRWWSVHPRRNKGCRLGIIRWWPHWRKYTFAPDAQTLYDPSCLREIADFCETSTKEHKGNR